MELIILIVGMVIGIASVLIGIRAEAVIRRHRARAQEQRRAAHEDELRRSGWTPPFTTTIVSPFPDWMSAQPEPVHNRFGF